MTNDWEPTVWVKYYRNTIGRIRRDGSRFYAEVLINGTDERKSLFSESTWAEAAEWVDRQMR